jgi:hypothetical protein
MTDPTMMGSPPAAICQAADSPAAGLSSQMNRTMIASPSMTVIKVKKTRSRVPHFVPNRKTAYREHTRKVAISVQFSDGNIVL